MKKYLDAFVDDPIHIEIQVVDLGQLLFVNHVLDEGVAFDEPE